MQVGVPQDAEQPGTGAAWVAQLVQALLRLAEGLLYQIFGIGAGTGQTIGVAIQRIGILLDQTLDHFRAAGQSHRTTSSSSMNRRRHIYSRRGEKKSLTFRPRLLLRAAEAHP